MVEGSDIEATPFQLGEHLKAKARSRVAEITSSAVREETDRGKARRLHGRPRSAARHLRLERS